MGSNFILFHEPRAEKIRSGGETLPLQHTTLTCFFPTLFVVHDLSYRGTTAPYCAVVYVLQEPHLFCDPYSGLEFDGGQKFDTPRHLLTYCSISSLLSPRKLAWTAKWQWARQHKKRNKLVRLSKLCKSNTSTTMSPTLANSADCKLFRCYAVV